MKYGIDWATIGISSEVDKELLCFMTDRKPSDGGLGRYRHFVNACKIIWPKLVWNDWLRDMIRSLCENKSIAWTGPGASGKTFSAGLFAMVWWLCSPDTSTVILTSTTGNMVKKRIWPVIQNLFHSAERISDSPLLCGGFVGNMVDSQTCLQATKGDNKNGIFAKAVRDGSTAKAVADIQGWHNDRMLVIIDEATDTPEGIFEATPNLRKGCSEFIHLIIGNPVSHLDPHGRICEPAKGWNRISIEMEEWETVGVPEWEVDPGVCLHFDGEKSPNMREDDKYPFLITRRDVERARGVGGEGAHGIAYWKFTRGFWPPEGVCDTIFTEAMCERMEVSGKHSFYSKRIPIAGLDPAFGGDGCVLKFGVLGDIDAAGKMGVTLTETIEIIPKAKSTKEIDFQIADRVISECKKHGVEPSHFGMDGTGIGRGVAAIIRTNWSSDIVVVEFNNAASQKPASTDDPRPSSEVYDRKVTELWYQCREMAMGGQLKGLTNEDIIEFCSREYVHEKRKICLSTKEQCKAALGRSPDNADCIAVMVEVARINGAVASTGYAQSESRIILKVAKAMHEVYDESNEETSGSAMTSAYGHDYGWD